MTGGEDEEREGKGETLAHGASYRGLPLSQGHVRACMRTCVYVCCLAWLAGTPLLYRLLRERQGSLPEDRPLCDAAGRAARAAAAALPPTAFQLVLRCAPHSFPGSGRTAHRMWPFTLCCM